jgi:hypothetical protein
MKDAITDEFYLSRMDWLKVIGIGIVLMIGITYIVFELLSPI